jgi:hypothetical protein
MFFSENLHIWNITNTHEEEEATAGCKLSTESTAKHLAIRWGSLKGTILLVLFLALAFLVEYAIVLYAIGLEAHDPTILQWSFILPGYSSPITIAFSPLFNLVPVAVVVTLTFIWTHLTKQLSGKTTEKRKGKSERTFRYANKRRTLTSRITQPARRFFSKIKSELLQVSSISNVWKKIHFVRVTLKSALIVLVAFILFVLVFSLLAHPDLIYQTVKNSYQSNPPLLNFVISASNSVEGFAEAISPIGFIGRSVNDGLLAVAPGVEDLGLGLGGSIISLTSLDSTSKYLVFQNAAAWALVACILLLFRDRRRRRYVRK